MQQPYTQGSVPQQRHQGQPHATSSAPVTSSAGMYPSMPAFEQPQQQYSQQPHQFQPQPQQQHAYYAPQQQQQQSQDHGMGQMLGQMASGMMSSGQVPWPMAMGVGTAVNQIIKPGWFSWLSFDYLRYYFMVSNSYVLNKIKIILLPFGHKSWKREAMSGMPTHGPSPINMGKQYKYPRDDINAPDLYIPAMSFITYILLTGLALGVYHRFDPEVLTMACSSALILLFLEVMIMKMGFYMLGENVETPGFVDLIAYASYKYTATLVDLVVGILLGYTPFALTTLITGCCVALFIMRTMKQVTSATIAGGPDHASVRNYFLMGLGLLQIVLCYFLVRSTIPSETELIE